jgi:hypothetical protein
MALNPATLQTALLSIFNAMNDMTSGGDRFFADEAASAMKTFILTGQVATADSGSAPAGVYTGTGTGTMTIDDRTLADDLFSTFTAEHGNNDLADHIATDVDKSCKRDNIVATNSTGAASEAAVRFHLPAQEKGNLPEQNHLLLVL